jgi:indole-3-glycerol phosphate synthase
VTEIPEHAIKIAESGLGAMDIAKVRHIHRYNAALVGTALLNSPNGVQWSLNEFEREIKASKRLVLPSRQSIRHTVPV